jgi:hypothetical protein
MDNARILYRYIRGSHAHGIATERSDVDYGGVFILPNWTLLSILPDSYQDEMADEKHDDTMWELNKFTRLLTTSNPTVLESLFVDRKFHEHIDPTIMPFFENRDWFLTKECFKPFGHYASAQIRKARGLNKMIVQPILERKTPVDFCYITYGNDTKPVSEWLEMNHLKEDDISLAKLNHARDSYAVFLHPGGFCKPNGNDVYCRDIPKGMNTVAILFFNKDAYTTHCKDYRNQKEWEAKRNPVRYESNLGKSYDAKNMCECIRLVRTCTEIANGETYNVNRAGIDADFLLKIRAHEYEYDELMDIATADIEKMDTAIANSVIPDTIDRGLIDSLMLSIRAKIG